MMPPGLADAIADFMRHHGFDGRPKGNGLPARAGVADVVSAVALDFDIGDTETGFGTEAGVIVTWIDTAGEGRSTSWRGDELVALWNYVVGGPS